MLNQKDQTERGKTGIYAGNSKKTKKNWSPAPAN